MNNEKVMTTYGRKPCCLGEIVVNDKGEKIFAKKIRHITRINKGLNAFGIERNAFKNRIENDTKFIRVEDTQSSKVYITRTKIWKENGLVLGSEIFLSLKYFMIFCFGDVTQEYPKDVIDELQREGVHQQSLFSFA